MRRADPREETAIALASGIYAASRRDAVIADNVNDAARPATVAMTA